MADKWKNKHFCGEKGILSSVIEKICLDTWTELNNIWKRVAKTGLTGYLIWGLPLTHHILTDKGVQKKLVEKCLFQAFWVLSFS